MEHWAVGFFLFMLGISFGSFLNVCIYRFPREESIVQPGSHCPECKKPILWYDNIPILSFLLLRAKCRYCGTKISPRYFLMELVSGVFWVVLWKVYGLSWFFAGAVILLSVLLAVSVTDLETGLIPDEFTFFGMTAGLFLSVAHPDMLGGADWAGGLIRAVVGLVAGGGILWLTGILGKFLFRKDSMGGGDVKLLAMLGVFLGVPKVILVYFLAPMLALPVALYLKWTHKSEIVLYGPYLAIAGVCLFLWGDWIIWFIYH